MANYKVLPLPNFVSRAANPHHRFHVETMEEMGYMPIKPIFKRDGWYYDRKKKWAWYEFHNKAWSGKKCTEDFLYELRQLDTKRLSKAERDAIKTLIIYGICPKELKYLLWQDNDNRMLQYTYWSARKSRQDILGKNKKHK
jgi:hypothetical protein